MDRTDPSATPPPPTPAAKPGSDDRTIVSDLSGGNQPTRLSDLAGGSGQATVLADLSGQPPTTTRPTVPAAGRVDASVLTAAPGSDVQDAIPTHLSDPARPKSGTDVTDLLVAGAGKVASAEGTHLGEVWGDFQFDRLLGRGGMGAVYLGRQVSLDRMVAIKVLPSQFSSNEQFRERFQLEAKAVAKMSSPHVVQVYAAGIHKGHHYFAMEYVEGEDLSRKLRTGFKPSYRQALELTIQAAKGLAAAGEHGIVHRDIKPGNMMIDRKGMLKLMDFGLVRLASAGNSLTMAGTVMGTVSYFSPEQGRGEACDQRTDLYALGVVFYELLTGRLPFTGENATSVIYQHIHAAPRLPRELDPNIPEDYQAVVLKCMQKNAADRYADALEMLADLERLLAGRPPAVALARPDLLRTGATIIGSGTFAPPASPAGVPAPERKRSGGRIAAVATAAAVLVAGGIWLARPLLWPAPAPVPAPIPIPVAPVIPLPVPVAPVIPAPVPPTLDPESRELLAAIKGSDDKEKARTDYIAKAQVHLADGDYVRAEAMLAAFLVENPGDPKVELALRQTQIARQEAVRQEAVRQEAIRLTAMVEAKLAAGDEALRRGDFATAQQCYLAAQQLDPRDTRVVAKLAEAERLRVAAQPVPVQPPPTQPAGPEVALAQARAAIDRGDLITARRLVDTNLALAPADPQWVALGKALDAGEGKGLLHEAKLAFSRGNVEVAARMAAQAKRQIPDDPELLALLGEITKNAGERTERDRIVAEAEKLLDAKKPAEAEKLLDPLARKFADDIRVQGVLNRARSERERAERERTEAETRQRLVDMALAQGDAALARGEFDAAQISYNEALRSDPKSERATAGLEQLRVRREAIAALAAQVEGAIKAGDLAAAETALAELKTKAPGGAQAPQALLAENLLNAAKLRAAEQRRQAEELERARVAQGKAVATLLDDPARPVAELEQALAAFRKDAGEQRPELPELERRLEDRKSHDAVVAAFAGLDAAMAGGKLTRAEIDTVIGDAALAEALAQLAVTKGATFRHRLVSLTRSGDTAVAKVAITTAMPEYPEETLSMRYELARAGSGEAWRLVKAAPTDP